MKIKQEGITITDRFYLKMVILLDHSKEKYRRLTTVAVLVLSILSCHHLVISVAPPSDYSLPIPRTLFSPFPLLHFSILCFSLPAIFKITLKYFINIVRTEFMHSINTVSWQCNPFCSLPVLLVLLSSFKIFKNQKQI